eukprot:CAMPEP_0176426358 /NCGR_PEP_ID=MMETSP0127-20121128/11896_1 /TAXON_ID=938130 /ORGANISM="Platyophrya macrostoma, Strain WH" /LENGTH=284 /DNA_ID=CAMNT_0017807613 /DNA_START=165 /DNA_END=1016 /DNA_ORIENTATION=+
MATLSDQGVYDTVMNLGSLVARLVFRLWEESCFAKWSRTMASASVVGDEVSDKGNQKTSSLGRFDACLQLLWTMLAVAWEVSLPFAIFGPPLARPLLTRLYAGQWSDITTTRVLIQLCLTLPLMATNGLLEAFVRATSTPTGLARSKWCMVATSCCYVVMCYTLLLTERNANEEGSSPLVALMTCLTVSTAIRIILNTWLIAATRQEYLGSSPGDPAVKQERFKHVTFWWDMSCEILRRSMRIPLVAACVGIHAFLSQVLALDDQQPLGFWHLSVGGAAGVAYA